MGYEVHVLHSGYSGSTDKGMVANCSCTLIRGRHNIIVDTMTPWDKDKIVSALALHKLTPDDIHFVVCTHGHSDHVGNNNLFLYAKHIVGFSVSFKDQYSLHPFEDGQPFVIDDDVKVIPTPGHTNTDVSVIVRTRSLGTVAIVGDLFEKEEDLKDASLWRTLGGSENPRSQERYRNAVLLMADYIVPGHGPMFPVTLAARDEANKKSTQSTGQVNYLPPSFVKSGFAPPSTFDSFGGNRWLADSSSNLRKRDPLGCSPHRHWEDRLTEQDGGSGISNKYPFEHSPKQDMYGGLRESDSKSFYESGSRSLDTRVNFEDVFGNRKIRETHDLNTGESNTWEKKRYTSDNILYGEEPKQKPNADVCSRVHENTLSKHSGHYKLGSSDECSATTSSKKSQESTKLSSRLDWKNLEERSNVDDKISWSSGELKSSHSYRMDLGKDAGVIDDKIKDQKMKIFSNDRLDLKEKILHDDKPEKSVSFNRNFYDKLGRGDGSSHDDTFDRYKKQDTKLYSFDKSDDWWKTEKSAKDSHYTGSDSKDSFDRNQRLKLDPSDPGQGSVLDSHSPKNVTMLANVTARREDRFNRVIT